MFRVKSVRAYPAYRLHIEFDDGVSGMVDLSPDLHGPMFDPLRDPRLFEQAFVDQYGAVCWPNGADLAPDALYKELSSQLDERPRPNLGKPGTSL